MKDFRIVFMGTPDFAVTSLKALVEHGFNVIAVVTAPDKPSGRGRKLKASPVKVYAEKMNIPVLQPRNMKEKDFSEQLKQLQPDLNVVVAFRMLPEMVWRIPTHHTINLHASLLPDYRGAAPINHAIINGEKETGVTTFFIDKAIDTGAIIDQERVPIEQNETAGELHDKLMHQGAQLLIKTAEKIASGNYVTKTQQELSSPEKIHPAPKIFKADCRIQWNKTMHELKHFIHGLSPFPTAWTKLRKKDTGKAYTLKIYRVENHQLSRPQKPAQIISDDEQVIAITCKDGALTIKELQLEGKKRMPVETFLRGTSVKQFEIVQYQ